jgi:hypothetical protein
MPKLKFSLLILDAGVVITLHQLGLWQQVVDRCDIHVSRVVAEVESLFHIDANSEPGDYGQDIDLGPDIAAGRITRFEVPIDQIRRFRDLFDDSYASGIHDGEAESLAYLFSQPGDWLISSGDAIVFKVLGNAGRSEDGISLEEILQRLGLSKPVDWQYTKAFRLKFDKVGSTDQIQGRGLK